MSEGSRRASWGLVSEVLAAIYNTVRDTKAKKNPFTGSDFNPTIERPKPKKKGVEAFGILLGMSPVETANLLSKRKNNAVSSSD